MRYVDTGSRDPKHALGSWLGEVLLGPTPIAALRLQTGFFGSDSLGYFEDALQRLAQDDGHTRILVGSNDGLTSRAAIANLLEIVGQPRVGLGVGVVSFQSGFFHPKVFHFQRADGSSTAYVGSANLTGSGTTSLHVEAGMILDTRQGDPQNVLESIADAVDAWFTEARDGLYEVTAHGDLDLLVEARVLGVSPPPRPSRRISPTKGNGQKALQGYSLKPLVAMPPIHTPLIEKPKGTSEPSTGVGTQTATPATSSPSLSTTLPPSSAPTHSPVAERWSKAISRSEAQRRAGHQSALIALTQGHRRHQIDQTKYFRYELCGAEAWSVEHTTSKHPLDVARVPMRVTVDGTDHGVLMFRISHARHRESGTNSPTTEIHLEPLLPLFAQADMTDKKVEVERFEDGTYALTIS